MKPDRPPAVAGFIDRKPLNQVCLKQGRIGHLAILANARGAGPFCLMWAGQIFIYIYI